MSVLLSGISKGINWYQDSTGSFVCSAIHSLKLIFMSIENLPEHAQNGYGISEDCHHNHTHHVYGND